MELKIKNEENRELLGDTLHHFTYFTSATRQPKVSIIVPLKQSIFKVKKSIDRSRMEHLARKLKELNKYEESEPERYKPYKRRTLQEAEGIFSTFIPLEEERNYIEQFILEAASSLYHVHLKPSDYSVYVVPSRIGGWETYISEYIRPFIQREEEAILVENKHFNKDRHSFLITFNKGESK
ncbi:MULTISPECIES: hypothetical protein [Cytobacillus]|uniref:Uncharacterized protein n=1 Tax=Cytobacillus horneckiae TaxID=549687 RepID=A0A2N0ZMY8_9BACI|nr:hypothetical protein [Cytobacillus horneckiae]MEC1159286.1 hypothetical protein [Cytobacillus horneckiae]PKG30880.1 hypothetical protein CWS20_00875 [Cytobacillus horneckiae]